MTEKKSPRSKVKTRKPALTPLINAIKDGRFDEELGKIETALNSRKDKLKEALEKEMKKLYGKDYIITQPTDVNLGFGPVAGGTGVLTATDPDPDPVAEPEPDPDFEEDDKGYVSRSPVIGNLPIDGALMEEE